MLTGALHFLFRGLYQESFSQANTFSQSRAFPTTTDFSMISEVFHRQRFFYDQVSFPQVKIFPQSGKFSSSKDFSTIREVFYNQGSFPQGKIFP